MASTEPSPNGDRLEKRSITMQNAKAALLLLMFAVSANDVDAQSETRVIFPEPLHIVREIEDPISEATVSVEEFFVGNRAIAISGDRVAITDYGDGTLTEIDHGSGTYSVATFEEMAGVRQRLRGSGSEQVATETLPQRELLTPRQVAGRVLETVAVDFDHGELRRMEVSVSDEFPLSREAFEIVAGAAFPNQPGRHSNALTGLARREQKGVRTAADGDRFSLPLQQIFVYEVDGERLVVSQRAVQVDRSLPDPRLLAIPADAERVENHLVRTQRLLEELDRLPGERESSRP